MPSPLLESTTDVTKTDVTNLSPLASLALLSKPVVNKANDKNHNQDADTTDNVAHIYPAEWADLPNIVAIYNANIASKRVTADLYPVTVSERESWFRSHLEDESRPIYVVKSALGDIMAWGCFSNVKNRPAYYISSEISIYVADIHQRRGIAKALITWMLTQAPSLKIEQVVALIFTHNTASLALFKRLGFEQWGILPDICDMGELKASVHILGRSISDS